MTAAKHISPEGPKTTDECRREIERLRVEEPDHDMLFVDALASKDGALVARLHCQFRAPYRCGVQRDAMLGDETKWQYRFSINPDDPARVLHEFMQAHSEALFEFALSYSDHHDRCRDNELRIQAEQAADQDAQIEERIEEELRMSGTGGIATREPQPNSESNEQSVRDGAAPLSTEQSKLEPESQAPIQPPADLPVIGPQKRHATATGLSDDGIAHVAELPRTSRRQRVIEHAESYRGRGWPVVRLVGKGAVDTGWPKATAASPMPNFGDTNNIGILLGDPAGGLVRPDFEWSAPNIATALFPEDFARFGRKSAPGTGLLVMSNGATSKSYALPEAMKDDPRLPQGHKDKLLVCELLSTGKQTMSPPSEHPDTGEEVVWEAYPATLPLLSPEDLDRRMGLYAFLSSVANFWTDDEHGYWYERGLALSGVMLEVYAELPEEQRVARVDTLVKATARDGGDTDWHRRGYAAATLEKIKSGTPVMGLPRLLELLALPPAVVETFRKWLGIGVASNPDIEQMNRDHAAGRVKGKFRVISWMPDSRYPRQRIAEFSGHDDFCNAVVNPKIIVPVFDKDGKKSGEKKIARGAWWLHQDRRAEFDGIDYVPGEPESIERQSHNGGRGLKILNMYSGFSVAPDYEDSEKKCSRYLAHVRDNICNDDEELYGYVLDWMASGVQRPEDPGRSALSMRGDPGAGKGVFATEYGRLFGRHFLHVTNRDHVTGKFNAHSAETCLIFVDEALYAEILADARILKTLVSETTKILERKGIDAIQIENFARLIFSTNDQHPLQIEHNDRRYCAIYVRTNALWANEPNKRRAAEKRRAYFKPIVEQMKTGGREALLGYLLQRDISAFNPEALPETTERNTQKLKSAPAGDKVIIEFALDGHLPGALPKRPWIARANGEGCLYPTMKQRGGRTLAHQSDTALSDILKDWKFKRHPLGDGAGWEAPALPELRDAIDAKYPDVQWDGRMKDWGHAASDRRGIAARELVDDEVPF
jgi:hypothetical protein